MTAILAARIGLSLRPWRAALVIGAICIALPLLMAAMVVEARGAKAQALVIPVPGATLTQAFGCTALEIEPWSAECATHHFHSGLDLAAPHDTPVYAANSGTATLHRQRGGYGLYLIVSRDTQLSTLYGHLDLPLVADGDRVDQGQAIALMGSSGNSTGPHLHFEVRIAGIPVDPVPLLPAFGQGGGR